MRRFLLSGLVLLTCPLASVAGQVPRLEPGQRVRVTAPSYDLRRTPATFHAIRADTLHFSVARGRSERSSGLEDSLVVAVPVDLAPSSGRVRVSSRLWPPVGLVPVARSVSLTKYPLHTAWRSAVWEDACWAQRSVRCRRGMCGVMCRSAAHT